MSKKNCTRCGTPYQETNTFYSPWLCLKCSKLYEVEFKELHNYFHTEPVVVDGVRLMLEGLQKIYPSLDLNSPHLAQTPTRVARMFIELCAGLNQDPVSHLETSFEESVYHGIVASTNIDFCSLCCHHLAVFRGIAHVGYIPNKRIVGLSKLNRVVEIFAARPQIQEQLTHQIASTIHNTLKPKGTIVLIEAHHDCIEVRGIKSKGSVTQTCEVFGVFAQNTKNCKEEFLQMVQRGRL